MHKKSFSLLLWLAVGLVWAVSGCRSEPPSGDAVGSARFVSRIDTSQVSTGVARVSVTLALPGEDFSRTLNLDNGGGEWTGTMDGIPAGDNRTFTAEAFGADGTKLFAGRATGVTITAGQTALVSLLLQQLSTPPPFDNAVPVIDSLLASASSVAPGGTLRLTVNAHDPNPGDSLTYAWTGSAGTFGSASSATTAWSAPTAEGPVSLSVTVTDSHGAVAAMTVSLTVRAPVSGTGGADIDVALNTWPQVARITASPSRVKPGESTTVVASASDVDGDALTYHWSATGCTGTWGDGGSATARFTPDAVPATGACECRLGVTVEDGRGGQGQGSLAICVGESPSATFPPVVVAASRSSDSATPGATLTLRVRAEDPQGSALGFTWTANTGTVGTPVDTASTSQVSWTAPACLDSGTPSVTVTVRNALGLSTPYTFTLPGLPECSPPHDSWSAIGSLSFGRADFTATLLPSGKVLVTGAAQYSSSLRTTEEYDPVTGLSLLGNGLQSHHRLETATLLPSGKVLVAGGGTRDVELYDPATGTSTPAGPLSRARTAHSATLLPSGQVLVVGGYDGDTGANLASAELYDPATGAWSPVNPPAASHYAHTATLLPSGQVLVVGGSSSGLAEVYDPATGAWHAAGTRGQRYWHAAVVLRSGKVLVTGGGGVPGSPPPCELYDPASNTWSATGQMLRERRGASAVVLASGKVLVTGGNSDEGELYDAATGTWASTGRMVMSRLASGMVLLPSGKALVLGGDDEQALAELYDPATNTWSTTGPRAVYRASPTVTALASGKVLVTGGASATAELYDPVTRAWSVTGSLRANRDSGQTATLLPSGRVLVVGGGSFAGPSPEATAELYEPVTGTWSPAGPPLAAHSGHTATLLPSGKVLVAGGGSSVAGGGSSVAELYDPETNTWARTGELRAARQGHTATLLPSGKVLVVGGDTERTAELYDSASGTWSAARAPSGEHLYPQALLLPSGRVLVVGGGEERTVESYDPETDTWSAAGTLLYERTAHTATLLLSGKVLVVGGEAGEAQATAELYDPATGTSRLVQGPGSERATHAATLLPSGQVLVVGGGFPGWALGLLYTP